MAAHEQTADLDEIDYRTSKLNAIWSDIRDILQEQGRLSGDELASKLDHEKYGYTEQTLANDVIPKLRKALQEQDILSVKLEDDGKIVQKQWVLDR